MEDITATAEKVIQSLQKENRKGEKVMYLTSSQIRKFLTAVNCMENKVSIYKAVNPGILELTEELAMEIKYLKVKLAYQAGREKEVKIFVEKAQLMHRIERIGKNLRAFEEFSRYMEALVAYHKFYGGKD